MHLRWSLIPSLRFHYTIRSVLLCACIAVLRMAEPPDFVKALINMAFERSITSPF